MIVKQREREAETQAEGESGSMHREPDVGLDPRSIRIAPWAKGRRQTVAPPRDPHLDVFLETISIHAHFLFFFFNFYLFMIVKQREREAET